MIKILPLGANIAPAAGARRVVIEREVKRFVENSNYA
jgi:hypothetical protein